MKSHDDEVAEQSAIQIHGEMVEMAVKHMRTSDARHDRREGESDNEGAWNESRLCLDWMQEYERLTS